jgi:4-amino-4-deoxy-L-arabinose transferase-like glycosyltransferase
MSVSRPSVLFVLLASAIWLYFVDLGGSSIWDANEAFYVETPREMIERGDYVSPTFNYEPRLNKPVLSYWIVAGFYKVFGISAGVQRLPIAIGAIVIIAAAFFLARAAWPEGNSSLAALAGSWAALGLAISPRLDIYVSMFMSLTLLFFALSERYPAKRRLFLPLMYASVGLGVLTKGPAFALLPGLVFAIYLAMHRELSRVREMMIPWGILVVLAIVLPWYAALYQRDGWTYITAFVLGENFARYTEGLGVNATRGPFFYLPVIFSDAFPLSIFLFIAAAAWISERYEPNASQDAARRVRTLLWLWIAGIVGFFSFSAAKQDLYILPIVPAVAALGGVSITTGLVQPRVARAIRVSTMVLGALLAALGAAVIYLFAGSGAVYAVKGTLLMGSIGLAGGIATLIFAMRAHATAGLLALAVAMIAMNWTFVLRVLPSFEAYKPVPGFARVLIERARPDDVIATYNVALPSLVYYLERHVDMAYDPAPIRFFLDSPRTAYVILSTSDYAALQEITAATTCVIGTQPTFDVKLRNLVARDPLPDLLLITNRCQ